MNNETEIPTPFPQTEWEQAIDGISAAINTEGADAADFTVDALTEAADGWGLTENEKIELLRSLIAHAEAAIDVARAVQEAAYEDRFDRD